MDIFSDEFREKLYKTIEQIEKNSLVEVVAIVRKQSEKYRDTALIVASVSAFLLFTIFMFIPYVIDYYLIYLSVIFFYLLVYFGIMSLPGLHSKLISQKRKDRTTEIMARAIFQKGGIRFTKERIGVLFFVSLFEKKVIILADRGVLTRVPAEELEKMQNSFDRIFDDDDFSTNFLRELTGTQEIFSRYIPPVENDINELPDDLKVDL
jgi:putative membrane protein